MLRTTLGSLLVAVALLGGVRVALADGLTEAERRGKEIYLRGVSPSGGEIVALLGDPAVEVPAGALPCGNCHGADGIGRPEGGSSPSDLRWSSLTKPYGSTHPSGREHGPYDEHSLRRAISLGLDPDGNTLSTVMPRYRLTRDDADDLVAYVRRLGRDHDPGIGERTITVGMLLPARRNQAEAARAALAAYFEAVNRRGGVYGRSLELAVATPIGDPADRRRAVDEFLDQSRPFALVAPYFAGAEAELAALLEERGIPAIGPIALEPQVSFPLNRQVFYLGEGLDGQAQVLQEWLTDFERRGGRGTAPVGPASVIYPRQARAERIVERLTDRADGASRASFQLAYPIGGFPAETVIRRARSADSERLLFLGSGEELVALVEEATADGWAPRIVCLGTLVGGAIGALPESFAGEIWLAYPSLPSSPSSIALAEYEELAREAGLRRGSLAAQLASLAAAKVFVEGLMRAGRELSREKLIAGLEGLYRFETGLGKPVTFGPNRRIGVPGAYLIELDVVERALKVPGIWVDQRGE